MSTIGSVRIGSLLVAITTGLLAGVPATARAQTTSPQPQTTSQTQTLPAPASQVCGGQAAGSDRCPLLEFTTADRTGSYYTLSSSDATTAQNKDHFIPREDAAGITLFTTQTQGTVPVYRLHSTTDAQLYEMSADPNEMAKKCSPNDPHRPFTDNGIIGYVYPGAQQATMQLSRYSKGTDYRVGRAKRTDLTDSGFHEDGVIGWVPQD